MYKIIGKDGQTYGPASVEQLRIWMAENRVNAQTLVQAEGAPDWKPLGEWPELAAHLKSPPVMGPPPSYASAPGAASKIPAGICGLLLGLLGIHKFLLGYQRAGLIMLLVTVLTCGVGACVMEVIGLIEGIIYLCKPDEEFVRIYVTGRREWF